MGLAQVFQFHRERQNVYRDLNMMNNKGHIPRYPANISGVYWMHNWVDLGRIPTTKKEN
jgi:hypothetical protein